MRDLGVGVPGDVVTQAQANVVDLIAHVLRRHQWGIYRDDAGFAHSGCMCQDASAARDYPGHVAAAVQESLNLTQEWAVQYSEPIAYSKARNEPPSDEILERTKRFFPGRIWVSRFVTGWLPSQSGDTHE